MENERPIKDCLKLIKRDMRLLNLAQPKREITDEQAELFNVLNSMVDLASAQLKVSREITGSYQEAHC
jgi:hypothetical protein